MTYEIYKSFDCNPPLDVRGTFLGIFKAFDKVWREDLICKLQTYVINGKLENLMKDFLRSRQQRVIPNGQKSPRESFGRLGPLLFLININDITE